MEISSTAMCCLWKMPSRITFPPFPVVLLTWTNRSIFKTTELKMTLYSVHMRKMLKWRACGYLYKGCDSCGLSWFFCLFFCLVSSNEHKLNFRKSKEACLSYIQDALLQKQWKRAAEFLTCYVESLEKDYSREHIGPSEVSPCSLSGFFCSWKSTCKAASIYFRANIS